MSSFQETSAGYLANHMARLFAAALQRRIQPLGRAPAQFMVLLELWREDGRTQADLVAALDVEQATMANTLARMERDGLVVRRASETDRRSRLVFLTEFARGLEAQAKDAARSLNAQALGGLDEAESAAFLSQMRRVVRNLQQD